MADSERSSTESVLLFLSGAVAGAALVVLMSPELRRKAGERLQTAYSTIRDETTEFLESEREVLAEGAKRLTTEAGALKTAYRAGWNAFREALEKKDEPEATRPSS